MGRPLKSFASATLNIQWPKENKEGKQLLYLLQITGPNNQSISCSPASEISPLKHAQVVRDTLHTTLYQSSDTSSGTGSYWMVDDFVGSVQVMFRRKRHAEDEAKASALSTDSLLSLFGSKRHYKYLVMSHFLTLLVTLLGTVDRLVLVLKSHYWFTHPRQQKRQKTFQNFCSGKKRKPFWSVTLANVQNTRCFFYFIYFTSSAESVLLNKLNTQLTLCTFFSCNCRRVRMSWSAWSSDAL